MMPVAQRRALVLETIVDQMLEQQAKRLTARR